MPVLQGNLRKEGEESIRKNYTFLLDELDGKDLVDHLFEGEVFDFDDKEEICQQVSRRERADLLLKKLLRSGPYQAYDVFLKALRKRYPHVAEKLERTAYGEHVGELEEMRHSSHKQEEIEQGVEIIKTLKSMGNVHFGGWCQRRHHHDSYITPSSFDIRHIPAGFQYQEVLDCVHSLAEQTVLVVEVSDQSQTSSGKESWSCRPLLCSGRIWRVQRNFSTRSNTTCPCKDCECSTTPKKRWGEYIVLTPCGFSRFSIFTLDELRFVLGYDSHKAVSDVSVLKAVSVIHRDESLGYGEILCITHDADTSKRVEDICHRNTVNREKLLNRCHLLQKDKKLAVHVSHPHYGPKHISVGEWLGYDSDSEPGSPRHVYTAVACNDGSMGGPVLLVDGSNASVTLHYDSDKHQNVGYSCGNLWSL